MPGVGDPALLFTGTDVLTGNPFSLADHQGKVVVVAISGLTWCGPCQFEAPILQDLWANAFKLCFPGVQFVIVSWLDETYHPGELAGAAQEFNITFPVVLTDDPNIPQLYASAVPTLFFLDPDLKVCGIKEGAPPPAATLRADILQRVHNCGLHCLPFPGRRWIAVAEILFGVTHDEGGVIISGGKPIPVPPWDPFRRLDSRKRDILLALAISELAGLLADSKTGRELEAASLRTIETAVRTLQAEAARAPPAFETPMSTAADAAKLSSRP